MGQLKVRKPLKIITFPFNLLVSLIVWLLFRVSWKEAWTGELDNKGLEK